VKIIQVPMDEHLLRAVDRKAKARRSSRAALIRAACAHYLEKAEEQELDRRHIEGYLRTPENPSFGETGVQLAAQVWPVEDWDEAR
jgi:metal-responsive CopG/Arc/MetJ family transcriptional regulator